MAVNKKHPLYKEYIVKCKAASEKYFAEEDAMRAQYPLQHGHDHPAGTELRAIALRHNAEIEALQKEYHFLFENSN